MEEKVVEPFEQFLDKNVVIYINVGSAQRQFFGVLDSYTAKFMSIRFRDGRIQIFNLNDLASIKLDDGRRID